MVKPEIGLSMLYCLGEPFEKMAEEIPKTRTTYIELVDDGSHTLDKKNVGALNRIRQCYDKKYTVHAPFVGINIALPPGPLLNATLKRLKSSIVNAAALDCEMWVFHSGMRTATSMFYPGMDWARNLESIRLLFRFARDHGVEASVENIMEAFVMKNVEEFERFYDEIGEDIGLAFDTGHANVVGELEGFLTRFSDKMVHVHAHDNHGKSDEHLCVGHGNIDWDLVAKHLKRVSFSKAAIVESVEHIDESIQRLERLLL
ncbi:MAG TPA: sugar phosphate isomerase/epimerase family protein [candidate division Zixibacteria bacterium]|nr:sugar phosphate isomerase/epimerase family protein [candidate division Zixibacteria bacterium]